MLDTEQFKARANQLFESCRERWRKKLERELPKGVKLSIAPEDVLPFTRFEFHKWLWSQVGLQAVSCNYCRGPIDVLSLQLDHKTPLRRGGGTELSNLQCLCADCNRAKGAFTHDEFARLVHFMEGQGASFRDRLMGVLKMGGLGTQMKFFPQQKKAAGPRKQRKVQSALGFALGEF